MDSILATQGVEVGRLRRVDLKAGDVVFREGDRADGAYLVESGVIEISKAAAAGEIATIALLKPGALFGELALIGKKPRSATAKAITDSVCYAMDRSQFEALMQGLDPFPRFVIRQLIHSLYRLTNIYVQNV